MKTNLIYTTLLTTFVFCTSFQTIIAQDVGSPAPDFSLEKLDGGTFKLSDQKGKVVMIFLLGNECPYCKAAGPSIQSELYEPYKSNDKYVAVGVDTWDASSNSTSLNNFKEVSEITFPLLLKGGSVSQAFNSTYDRLLVVDAEGKLAYKKNSTSLNTISEVKQVIEAKLGLATGINEILNAQNISIYPNPFATELSIDLKLEKATDIHLNLFDITGKLVKPVFEGFMNEESPNFKIQREQLKAGVYFLEIEINGKSFSKKIIVQDQ